MTITEIILLGAILFTFVTIEFVMIKFLEKKKVDINREFETEMKKYESEMKDCEDRINASFQNITKTLKEILNEN